MDELVHPTSFCSPPSPASFSATGEFPVLELLSSEVPEQWLLDGTVWDDDYVQDGTVWGDGGSRSAGSDLSMNPPATVEKRRRGRKPLPRTDGAPVISHVEAERQRRDKLNRRFCDLRAAVPTVSRMDKASLLADAATYITELRRRVEQLEAEVTQTAERKAAHPPVDAAAAAAASCFHDSLGGGLLQEKLEVRTMVGRQAAALRLTTTAASRHAPALLMDALRELNLPVQHACVCRVGDAVIVQDAVVDVPAAALRDEGSLRAALLDVLCRR